MMETQAVTGPLTAIGATTKAFILAHPVGVAIAGSALLGYGAYKLLKKKDTTEEIEQEEETGAEPATA